MSATVEWIAVPVCARTYERRRYNGKHHLMFVNNQLSGYA